MKNKRIGIIALVIITSVILAIAIIVFTGGNDRKLKKQLDLGHKYLSEMNYEEAIVSFAKALEIDPMSADAYLGLADAYIGKDDFETAKTTLEGGIKILKDAGKDTLTLENKLAEIEELIAAKGQPVAEVESLEEEESVYPTIYIEPIMSSLSNVWGRNWNDWTIKDFVSEFNLPQTSEGNWQEECSKAKYQNRAYTNDGKSMMWTVFHYEDANSSHVVSCKSLNYTSDNRVFFQTIKWYEYNEAIPENPVIHDDLCAFAEENGINSLLDVATYFGLNIDEIGDYEKPMKVHTEYGMADVSYIISETGDGYYNYITVYNIENLEGFYFTFTESHTDFFFTASQYK